VLRASAAGRWRGPLPWDGPVRHRPGYPASSRCRSRPSLRRPAAAAARGLRLTMRVRIGGERKGEGLRFFVRVEIRCILS
jgi:hypothetical protein